MSDPAQEAAARTALTDAAGRLGIDWTDLRVTRVLRRRPANRKTEHFYYVDIEDTHGCGLYYRVHSNGELVLENERWGSKVQAH